MKDESIGTYGPDKYDKYQVVKGNQVGDGKYYSIKRGPIAQGSLNDVVADGLQTFEDNQTNFTCYDSATYKEPGTGDE